MRFKNLEGKPEKESPKRTISASDALRLLQMVSEPDTGRCASEEAEPQRGVDTKRYARKDAGPPKGGGLGSSTLIGKGNECQRGR